jgi:hypothetical protein
MMVPPRVEASPHSALVEEGEAITLTCLAHGVPPPTILWSFQVGTLCPFNILWSCQVEMIGPPIILWSYQVRIIFPLTILCSFQKGIFS